jgi:hypothetical protein
LNCLRSRGKAEEKKEDLVIPLKDSVPLWQRKLIAKRREKGLIKETAENGIKLEPVSLDDLAAQELIRGNFRNFMFFLTFQKIDFIEAAEKMAEKEVENTNTLIYMNLDENEVEDDKEEVLFKTKVPIIDY